MKFTKKKITGFMGTEVHFTCDQVQHGYEPFKLVASKEGVYLDGRSPILESSISLEELAKVVGSAMAEHVALLHSQIITPGH